MKNTNIFFLIALLFSQSFSFSQEYKIEKQTLGPAKSNCYLLYDIKSKEAALFDVGGYPDLLINTIENNDLKLKYIFATHSHLDHLEGTPVIRQKYPEAKLCYSKKEYEDLLVSREWLMKNSDSAQIAKMKQDTAQAKWLKYDLTIFGPPQINVEEGQVYKLGELEIKTLLTPGHSRGSICYYFADALISGDLLSYRTVGRSDLGGGSAKDLELSVRRLYELFPDSTIVYPGHRQATDIGSEKRENKKIKYNK